MRILLVEDNGPLRLALAKKLRSEGFIVDDTADGAEARWFARENDYVVAIFDIGLPNVSGLELIADVHSRDNAASVLIVTARDSIADRIKGLDAGADDYMVKPFALGEMMARVRALVRRKHGVKDPTIRIGDLEMDTSRHSVSRGGVPIELTAREYGLLEMLMLNAGHLVKRADVWEQLYETGNSGDSNVVDVFITYLRKKLEAGGQSRIIQTRRGQGYIIEKEGGA
jgi:DNA-binding response OmpR family regulator